MSVFHMLFEFLLFIIILFINLLSVVYLCLFLSK